ncbi:hypothetical protein [Ruminococcus albus]|uniref:hypothetical protein n=1 Tax=Ruminococcus albus TaxID=1264 RepID=UPI000463C784|nr:hypothetical protein [Ruminococcus albus]
MLRFIKEHIIKIIFLAIVLLFWGFFVYSFEKYAARGTKLHEKTSFTDQETKILWSELGLDYIDLDISKAYYNIYSHRLFVVSEGFDSVDAQIKYLKQFNEDVHIGDMVKNENKTDDDKRNNIQEILGIRYNTDIDNENKSIVCITYEENGKYYLRFYKSGAAMIEADEDFTYIKSRIKTYEKTTFTDQEKKNLWSELGLEYIDLDISKAYYRSSQNRVEKLFVISEGFDSIDAELEYLKQFKGNENVCQGQEDYKIYNISYNTFIDHSNLLIECTTYKENGKYYLKFIKNEAEHSGNNTILYEMFGIDDSGKQ